MKTLSIFINDQVVYEYDRDTIVEKEKLGFLDNMDTDMEKGITIQGERIATPDSQQRARFVVLNLIKALQQDNGAIISVSCAYLTNRQPALLEVHANDADNGINISFVDEH